MFIENVSLFSQFYIILWFNKFNNVLKDTANQVKYTTKEEQIHALAGVKIINTIREELPELFDEDLKSLVLEQAERAYRAECDVIDWILKDFDEPKLNAELLKGFVASRLNESLSLIGYGKPLPVDPNIEIETEWMDMMVYGKSRTDFFHGHSIDYSRDDQSFTVEAVFGVSR